MLNPSRFASAAAAAAATAAQHSRKPTLIPEPESNIHMIESIQSSLHPLLINSTMNASQLTESATFSPLSSMNEEANQQQQQQQSNRLDENSTKQIMSGLKIMKEDRSMGDMSALMAITQNIQFFRKYFVDDEILFKWCSSMHLQTLPANSIVFEKGQRGQEFYLIIQGHVEVYDEYLSAKARFSNVLQSNSLSESTQLNPADTSNTSDLKTSQKFPMNPNTPRQKKLKKSIQIPAFQTMSRTSSTTSLAANFDESSPEGLEAKWNELQRRKQLVLVRRLVEGDSFGEMALIYRKPRSATVKCATECTFAVLHKDLFKEVLNTSESKRIAAAINNLSSMPIFATLSKEALREVYVGAETVHYKRGDPVYLKGDTPNSVYIIQAGEFSVNHRFNIGYMNNSTENNKQTSEQQQQMLQQRQLTESILQSANELRRYSEIPACRVFTLMNMCVNELFGESELILSEPRRYDVICSSYAGSLLRIKDVDFSTRIYNRSQDTREFISMRMTTKAEHIQAKEDSLQAQFGKYKNFFVENRSELKDQLFQQILIVSSNSALRTPQPSLKNTESNTLQPSLSTINTKESLMITSQFAASRPSSNSNSNSKRRPQTCQSTSSRSRSRSHSHSHNPFQRNSNPSNGTLANNNNPNPSEHPERINTATTFSYNPTITIDTSSRKSLNLSTHNSHRQHSAETHNNRYNNSTTTTRPLSSEMKSNTNPTLQITQKQQIQIEQQQQPNQTNELQQSPSNDSLARMPRPSPHPLQKDRLQSTKSNGKIEQIGFYDVRVQNRKRLMMAPKYNYANYISDSSTGSNKDRYLIPIKKFMGKVSQIKQPLIIHLARDLNSRSLENHTHSLNSNINKNHTDNSYNPQEINAIPSTKPRNQISKSLTPNKLNINAIPSAIPNTNQISNLNNSNNIATTTSTTQIQSTPPFNPQPQISALEKRACNSAKSLLFRNNAVSRNRREEFQKRPSTQQTEPNHQNHHQLLYYDWDTLRYSGQVSHFDSPSQTSRQKYNSQAEELRIYSQQRTTNSSCTISTTTEPWPIVQMLESYREDTESLRNPSISVASEHQHWHQLHQQEPTNESIPSGYSLAYTTVIQPQNQLQTNKQLTSTTTESDEFATATHRVTPSSNSFNSTIDPAAAVPTHQTTAENPKNGIQQVKERHSKDTNQRPHTTKHHRRVVFDSTEQI